jgi:hypothetical protein
MDSLVKAFRSRPFRRSVAAGAAALLLAALSTSHQAASKSALDHRGGVIR